MKILYVVTALAQGGAERVVCDLADEMFEKGYDVKIAYLTGDISTRPIHEEIELVKINLNNLVSLPKAYLNLLLFIKAYQPDVVHSHMVHANLLTRLVRLLTPMNKLISTAHNSNEGGWELMLLYRITNSLADTTTNVSKEATLAFEDKGAVPKNGMITVYNGIDLNKFKRYTKARLELNDELNLNQNCKIILAAGRFNQQKDYPNLLKAIQVLKKETSFPFKLVIAGDGELRTLLERTINDLDLQQEVVLLGRRSDISKLMSAADLFVLPSKYEGFGLVVAEAMACECLVVATDCGGVAEVLNSSKFLVPPCDFIALADKIKYALGIDENLRKDIIQKNIEHVQNKFSLVSIANKWVDLYNEK